MRQRLVKWHVFLIILTAIAAFTGPAIAAADKKAADILPPTTVAYLEINHPKDLISFVFDSPLKQKVDQSEQYRKAIAEPKFKEFQAVVSLIESKVGLKWREALGNTVGGGIVIAFDADTQGLIILAKATNARTSDDVRDAFFSLVRGDAQNKGNPDPIEKLDYNGLTAFKAGDGIIANVGPWLMLSNKSELAKASADLFLNGGASLAKDHAFSQASAAADPTSTAWAFVHLEPIRAISDQPWLDPKYKSDNPVLELLAGGLLPVLRKAEYLSASLSIKDGDLKLALAAPVDAEVLTSSRKFFFAASGDGAGKPLRPEGTMASISLYRDVSALWQAAPDLFNEAIATQMAQADSGLSTFFGGKQFGADVLGAFKPQIQLVAVKQDYKAAGVNEPGLRLPGFALVFRVKADQFATIRKNLRVGFQSAIAIGNLDGASKGRPALDMQSEKRGSADILYSTYDMADKATAKDDAYLNFSPSLVTSKDYFMLCSTKQIAEQLADQAEKQGTATIAENTLLDLDGGAIASLIKADREPLIAQNMLEKGHDRAAAEREIDLLATLVSYIKDAQLRLTPRAHDMQLELEVKTADIATDEHK